MFTGIGGVVQQLDRGIHKLMIASFFLLSLSAHAAENKSGVDVKWGYKGGKGPSHWGQLSPDFALCSNGKQQSPINIPKKVEKGSDVLKINYKASPVWIVDYGETAISLGDQHMLVNTGHGVQLNFHEDGVPEMVNYAGNDYRLLQFHLHTPSETKMNQKSYPLEIHFVHQGNDGSALVVAVLAKEGKPSATAKMIIDNLPADHGQEHEIKSGMVNPVNLLPANQGMHYDFPGSLTTPPCTEGIHWVVLKDVITMSHEQIAKLRKAMGGPNARPVQPLNNRKVYYVEG